ncbi:MAG: isoaspartyl peptidase/L-asparaginase [Planctomycetota bacterium]|nr:isoaspartyl peptidase/L-asparaginase [Planctomycetota bacterium]
MDKPPPPRPAIIVHAGAWAIPPEEKEVHRLGCLTAVQAGWAVLVEGGKAIDAVRAAVRSMEDDRNLNAGSGSVLTRGGHVELDAGLMNGTTLDCGAVAAVRNRKNPIEAAYEVLKTKYVLMTGFGGMEFLDEHGVPTVDPESLIEERERARLVDALQRDPGDGLDFGHAGVNLPGDTVGAVAIDRIGRIAAGASTGGICGKPPGRMGDTPIPGAGYYADDLAAGAACTGWGEPLLRMGLARRAVDLAREHNAMDATWLALKEFEERFYGRGGVILIGRDGSIGFSFNTPSMATAYMDEELQSPFVGGIAAD